MPYTYEQFVDDIEICGVSPYAMNTRFVYDMWSQPHRRYHGLSHLEHGLKLAPKVAEQYGRAVQISKVVSAWVLHDLVYTIGCHLNEVNSADFVQYVARENDYTEIRQAVCSTAMHDNPRSLLDCIIIDMDLWGLGADWDTYVKNMWDVKAEYAQQYTEDQWVDGRHKFLAERLSRQNVYWTPLGFKREEQARSNMTAELNSL